MGKKVAAGRPRASHARIGLLLKGIIYGMYLAGNTVSEIASEVLTPDGASPTEVAVRVAIAFVAAHGGMLFDGVAEKHGGGRSKVASDALDNKISRILRETLVRPT